MACGSWHLLNIFISLMIHLESHRLLTGGAELSRAEGTAVELGTLVHFGSGQHIEAYGIGF
jgi:hypothetical protein